MPNSRYKVHKTADHLVYLVTLKNIYIDLWSGRSIGLIRLFIGCLGGSHRSISSAAPPLFFGCLAEDVTLFIGTVWERHCNKVISIPIAIQMPEAGWKVQNAAQVAGEDAAQMSLSVRLILMWFCGGCRVALGWCRGGGNVVQPDKSINMQPASYKFQSNGQQANRRHMPQVDPATRSRCLCLALHSPSCHLPCSRFTPFANLFATVKLQKLELS